MCAHICLHMCVCMSAFVCHCKTFPETFAFLWMFTMGINQVPGDDSHPRIFTNMQIWPRELLTPYIIKYSRGIWYLCLALLSLEEKKSKNYNMRNTIIIWYHRMQLEMFVLQNKIKLFWGGWCHLVNDHCNTSKFIHCNLICFVEWTTK